MIVAINDGLVNLAGSHLSIRELRATTEVKESGSKGTLDDALREIRAQRDGVGAEAGDAAASQRSPKKSPTPRKSMLVKKAFATAPASE
jgi:hypothetical protein